MPSRRTLKLPSRFSRRWRLSLATTDPKPRSRSGSSAARRAGRTSEVAMAAQSSAFQAALGGRRLRANPAFELVLHDRLPAPDRRQLADLERDPEHYGVLRPRLPGSGLGLRAVDRETALLFLTLGLPGPLPGYVRARLGIDAAEAVARLVADAVLEVEAVAGG